MQDEPKFLGRGWAFPPSFGLGGATVHIVSGAEDVEQSLLILLSTQLGERVMQPDFGCDLQGYLFEEINNTLISSLRSLISDAILLHEPRVILDEIMIDESNDRRGLLLIQLIYTIRATNSRFNMVYPFYINEASTT